LFAATLVSAQDSRPQGFHHDGLELRPASDEFRRLHRLPDTTAVWVIEKTPPSERWPGLRAGDVVVGDVKVGQVRVDRFRICFRNHEPVAITDLAGKGETADQMVDRLWNQEVARFLGAESRSASRPASMPTETADQMVDRLWSQAVQKAVAEAGNPAEQSSVPESQPFRK
jgi:hypothetical protein